MVDQKCYSHCEALTSGFTTICDNGDNRNRFERGLCRFKVDKALDGYYCICVGVMCLCLRNNGSTFITIN